MAAGNISAVHPTAGTSDVANLGQVWDPQSVADLCATVNGIVKQTSANSSYGANKVTSLRSVVIDGTGGVATAPPAAGTLTLSGGPATNVIGSLVSSVATSKTILVTGSGWGPSTTADWSMSQAYGFWRTVTTGATALLASIMLPYSSSTTTITRIDAYVNKINTSSSAVWVYTTNPTTGGSASQGSASSTTAGAQTLSVTGLSLVLSDTQQVVVFYNPVAAINDVVYGVKVTYSSTVF